MYTRGEAIKKVGISRDAFLKLADEMGIEPRRGYGKATKNSKGARHRVNAWIYTDEQVAQITTAYQETINSQPAIPSGGRGEEARNAAQLRFNKAKNLAHLQVSVKEISRILAVDKVTIDRYLSCKTYEEYRDRFIPKPAPKPEPVKPVEPATQTLKERLVVEEAKTDLESAVTIQLLKQIDAKLFKLLLVAEREEKERKDAEQKVLKEKTNGIVKSFWRS